MFTITMNYALLSTALLIVASGALLILCYWLLTNVKKRNIHQKFGLGQILENIKKYIV